MLVISRTSYRAKRRRRRSVWRVVTELLSSKKSKHFSALKRKKLEAFGAEWPPNEASALRISDDHACSFERFSLYSLEPNVSLSFGKGVTCLAGANGIGKSNLLATMNFGLTGAVLSPKRRLLSTGQYLRDAQEYTSDYFEGRISEEDRDVAAITLEFKIGKIEYSVQRAIVSGVVVEVMFKVKFRE